MTEQIFSYGFLVALAAAAVRMAAPILYAGLGELYLERAGILNMGLEAAMLSGAFSAFFAVHFTGSLLMGVLGGMAGGCAVTLIHAILSVRMAQNQSVSGIALNIFFLGATTFLFRAMVRGRELPQIATFRNIKIPVLSEIPVIGNALFNQDVLVYLLYLLLLISAVLLGHTAWGLSLTAIGENPRAADNMGIRVHGMQYFAAVINGCLGGVGGAYLTIVQVGVFGENITSGRGYMALAAVILGRHHPVGVALASLLFGAADALQVRLQAAGFPLPSQALAMLPYLITLATLLLMTKRSSGPASLGTAYIRSKR